MTKMCFMKILCSIKIKNFGSKIVSWILKFEKFGVTSVCWYKFATKKKFVVNLSMVEKPFFDCGKNENNPFQYTMYSFEHSIRACIQCKIASHPIPESQRSIRITFYILNRLANFCKLYYAINWVYKPIFSASVCIVSKSVWASNTYRSVKLQTIPKTRNETPNPKIRFVNNLVHLSRSCCFRRPSLTCIYSYTERNIDA